MVGVGLVRGEGCSDRQGVAERCGNEGKACLNGDEGVYGGSVHEDALIKGFDEERG